MKPYPALKSVALAALTIFAPYAWGDDLELKVNRHDLAVQAQETERWLQIQGLLFRDTAVEDYLNSTMQRLLPSDTASYTIRIVRAVEPNAFSFANNYIVISLGLLLSMHDEDEVAYLLAHEAAHTSANHHVLDRYELHEESRKNALQKAFWGSDPQSRMLLRALSGFSQNKERQADSLAIHCVVAAGYDGSGSTNLFRTLDRCEKLMPQGQRTSLYPTHPETAVRIAFCEKEIKRIEDTQDLSVQILDAESRYRSVVAPLAQEGIELCLSTLAWNLAQVLIGSYLRPSESEALAYRIRLYLQRNGNADPDSAVRCCRLRVGAEGAYPTLHRDLGFAFLKMGATDSAKSHLSLYSLAEPTSPDAGFIRLYLEPARE